MVYQTPFGVVMDTLSFLPKRFQLLNVSSQQSDQKTKHTAKRSPLLTSFHYPITKLIVHKAQDLDSVPTKKPQHSLLATIFKSLDDFVCNFIDLPLRPSNDPEHLLTGPFAPVEEEFPPTACKVVVGSLPSCLDGAYIRNGPNPQFKPRSPYHWFDGDGMLHMIKISRGKATFCSRYVKTYKYLVEREIGYPFFPSFFASFNGLGASVARIWIIFARVLTGQFDPMTNGFGVANTNLALFSGSIFALCESDLPYALKVTADGDIITLGRHSFHSSEAFYRMTAHPKIDLATGEAFAYAFDFVRPFLTYFRIDAEGRKQKNVSISSTKGIAVIHDFAVTENYAIFPDLQIVFNPSQIVSGKPPMGADTAKVPRLGIIPKYAKDDSEMWWIDVPGFNLLHCCNAWEEDGGETIVILASNMVNVEQALESIDKAESSMEKITINVKAKTLQRHPLSTRVLEFGVINPAYATKKNRYLYAAVIEPKTIAGVVKLDLSLMTKVDGNGCTVASRLYGLGCCGGEALFVAREPDNPIAEEDDGYLVTYVHDEKNNESNFIVMDAKSPTLDIVAVVKLPGRVPCGFHGLFVSDSDLNKL